MRAFVRVTTVIHQQGLFYPAVRQHRPHRQSSLSWYFESEATPGGTSIEPDCVYLIERFEASSPVVSRHSAALYIGNRHGPELERPSLFLRALPRAHFHCCFGIFGVWQCFAM